MGVSNGIVTAPINPQEVYKLLGVGAYNGWWDIGYICSNKHGRINKLSLHKPVKWEDLDYSVAPSVVQKQWWSGRDGDYGISVPWAKHDNLRNGRGYGLFQGEFWGYKPPRGSEYFETYRINDFEGYTHSGIYPNIGKTIPLDITWSSEESFVLNKTFGMNMTVGVPPSGLLSFWQGLGGGAGFGLGMIFMIQDKDSSEADQYGYIYRMTTMGTMATSIPPGQRVEKTDGTIYRVDENIFSIDVKLRDEVFGKYVNNKIMVRPLVSKSPISFMEASSSAIDITTPFIDSTVDIQRGYTLKPESYDPSYKRPTVSITLGSISRSGTTITISGFTIVYSKVGNIPPALAIYISGVSGYTLNNPSGSGYNNYYTRTEYHDIPTLEETQVTLNYLAGSTATYKYNKTITIVASGTDKVIASIAVGVKVRNNGDSFSVSKNSIEIV